MAREAELFQCSEEECGASQDAEEPEEHMLWRDPSSSSAARRTRRELRRRKELEEHMLWHASRLFQCARGGGASFKWLKD